MKSADERIAAMTFNSIYPLYVNKVIRKGRTNEELDEIICWFLAMNQQKLEEYKNLPISFEQLFHEQTPVATCSLITGKICGVDIQSIENKLTKYVRQIDKIVDELAQGRTIERIKRTSIQ